MTGEATAKQIKFAQSLGIENPQSFSSKVLSEMINAKLGKPPAQHENSQFSPVSASNSVFQGNNTTQLVIHRNERANSYEFGKAGNRFKVYFEDAHDLDRKLKDLEDNGLYERYEPERVGEVN